MQVSEIKTYLKKQKITYEALSLKSGIPLGTLKSIFSGRTPNPRIDTIKTIEDALGLTNRYEWTEEEKALGVGRRATYLSEDEWKWLEIRSEILRIHGDKYLNTVITMLTALIEQKN